MMEHEFEPVPGLPESLPSGERLLWQGRPNWWALASRAYHVRGVGFYFALLLVWRGAVAYGDGTPLTEMGAVLMPLVLLGAAAAAILSVLAFLAARSAMFTVTSRRIVIRCGVALPMAINIPFTRITAADMRVHADGTGDLPVSVGGGERVSYILLWPFVRPWKLGNPQPMLRGVPDAAHVGTVLAGALAAAARAQTATGIAPASAPGAGPVASSNAEAGMPAGMEGAHA